MLPGMNERFIPVATSELRTTQAAEGLRRRAFTVAEIEAIVEAGIIAENERFELIGGEVVPMSAKGLRHERLKTWVNRQLAKQLPDSIGFTPETTFRLSPDTFLEPDFVLYDTAIGLEGLNGATCLLAIEIADTSLDYDKGRKALIFAGFGIPELWVIDAVTRLTTVFREPSPVGYRRVVDVRPEDALTAQTVAGLELRLGEYA
jgi:Uma2 family endonuclease